VFDTACVWAGDRLPGMDCNPYLAIAASLACGYLGLKEAQQPSDVFSGDAYDSDSDVPRTFGEALDLFAGSKQMREVLDPGFCAVYEAVKGLEYKEFLQVISPWEREHLLMNV
ncbi:MAG: glutamine synthetase, partial [Pseudomonadota bacterium]